EVTKPNTSKSKLLGYTLFSPGHGSKIRKAWQPNHAIPLGRIDARPSQFLNKVVVYRASESATLRPTEMVDYAATKQQKNDALYMLRG
ncbi:MAG: hypothetical protein ABL925_02670, partial [Methylococcales bacterium]